MEEINKGRGKISSIRVKPVDTSIEYENDDRINLSTFKIFADDPKSLATGQINLNEYNLENFNYEGLDNNIIKLLAIAGKLSLSNEANNQVKDLLESYNKIVKEDKSKENLEGINLEEDKEKLRQILSFDLERLNSINLKDVNQGTDKFNKKQFKNIKIELEKTAVDAQILDIISQDSITIPKPIEESSLKRFFRKFGVWLGIGGAAAALAAGVVATNETNNTNNTAIEQENDKNESNEKDDFRKGLEVSENGTKVEITSPKVEDNNTKAEIDELKTEKDVLAYLKNMYIEEYSKITGDETLTTENIKMILSSQDYEYKMDDGRIITHGKTPDITENAIKESGQNYELNYNKKYYTVYKTINQDEKEIIDCIRFENNGNGNEVALQVIPGDRYEEMKDGYPSALKNISQIVKNSFSLMDLLEKSSNGENISYINNAKEKLASSVEEYENKTESEQDKNQEEENEL